MSANTEADREAALALLSPEERAAIVDELSDDEKAALAAIAAGDDDDDAEAEAAAAAAKPAVKVAPVEAAAAPAVKTEPAAKPAEAAVVAPAAAAAVTTEDEPAPFKAHYQAELPKDFDDQVKAVDTAENELAEKFKAGDLDVNEFLAEQRAIAAKRADLQQIKAQANTFDEINKQNGAQEWNWHVGRFLSQVQKAEGIDYATDPEKGPDFDNFVKALASREENKDKGFTWFLTEAHKRVKALYGIADKPKADDPVPKKEEKPAGRPAPVGNLPATLALVPGGDGPGDVGGDEFANLDALTGMEYEFALAKLPKEVRERYLAAA